MQPEGVRSVLIRGAGARAFHAQSTVRSTSTLGTSLGLGAFVGGVVLVGTAVWAETVDHAKIRKEIEALLTPQHEDYDDGSYGPLLVRLAWHGMFFFFFFQLSI